MKLHNDDGLDLTAAREQLDAAGLISNERRARDAVLTVQTAALLDIASSLRVVALEAAYAMPGTTADDTHDVTMSDRDDFFVQGDVVHMLDFPDRVGEVGTLGFDGDGQLWADVVFPESGSQRVYASNLARVTDDFDPAPAGLTAPAETIDAEGRRLGVLDGDVVDLDNGEILDDAELATVDAIDDDEPITASDIDADFALDPLEALKAKQARKKGGKK